ncbi:hypothetical protein [Loktanella sp. Alg231-35]|uniref:hypothetical protein n=1 Tax=Loktanella sp. Alg231-35 TaxID=1922220 RepID=UPI000D5523D8|nr:hypothetical protein [Loktanella sp. Alg231-35]
MNMQRKQNAPAGRGVSCCARVASSTSESADDYIGFVTDLDARHRVILCRDGLQWIIQVRRGQDRRRGAWRGKSYLTTRESLIAACDALCGPLSSGACAALAAVPAKPEVMR